jgi:ketosteroid isomerase-like protein
MVYGQRIDSEFYCKHSDKHFKEKRMKSWLFLIGAAFALSGMVATGAPSQNQQPATAQGEIKVKAKAGKIISRDKSKPVRRAIEAWYERNVEAFKRKDVAAIMALRTEDFHTLTPDGKTNTRADMERYTQGFLARIDHFISQDIQIGTIDLQGELASADVTQKTVRMQRLQDGKLHKVEAQVVQRETWRGLDDGWKLYRVDKVRDGSLFVDDKPYKPGQ